MASRIRSFYSVAVLYECIQSYCVNFLLSGSCVKALTVVDKMMSRSRSVVRPGISSIDRTQSVHFVRVAFRADASRDLFSSFSTAARRKSRHLHQEVSWSPMVSHCTQAMRSFSLPCLPPIFFNVTDGLFQEPVWNTACCRVLLVAPVARAKRYGLRGRPDGRQCGDRCVQCPRFSLLCFRRSFSDNFCCPSSARRWGEASWET